MLEKFAEEVAVEPREGEPLCPTRCCGDDVDVLGTKTSVAKERVGISTGKQGKRMHTSIVMRNKTADGRKRQTGDVRGRWQLAERHGSSAICRPPSAVSRLQFSAVCRLRSRFRQIEVPRAATFHVEPGEVLGLLGLTVRFPLFPIPYSRFPIPDSLLTAPS